jgi:hypothetical protein
MITTPQIPVVIFYTTSEVPVWFIVKDTPLFQRNGELCRRNSAVFVVWDESATHHLFSALTLNAAIRYCKMNGRSYELVDWR